MRNGVRRTEQRIIVSGANCKFVGIANKQPDDSGTIGPANKSCGGLRNDSGGNSAASAQPSEIALHQCSSGAAEADKHSARIARVLLPDHYAGLRQELDPANRCAVRHACSMGETRCRHLLAPCGSAVEVEQYIPGWVGEQARPERLLTQTPRLEPPTYDSETSVAKGKLTGFRIVSCKGMFGPCSRAWFIRAIVHRRCLWRQLPDIPDTLEGSH
jgi:hypothetical protein